MVYPQARTTKCAKILHINFTQKELVWEYTACMAKKHMKNHSTATLEKSPIRLTGSAPELPIKHWSYSSLMAYLRNPLAWYKRYVEHIYDTPRSPSAIIGSAAHLALQHYYSGIEKSGAIDLGLEYLRNVPDFEINFGKAKTRTAQKNKKLSMEQEYLQAIGFYLEKPPKHKVVAVEMRGTAVVPGIPLPLKAVSDLVVESTLQKGALDVVDHKFVDYFSPSGKDKTLFVMQAIFNYYTVQAEFNKPVRRFLLFELKKRRNLDGRPQLKRYIIDYKDQKEAFKVFHRLVNEATEQMLHTKHFLPNPGDMFEGENSFDIYKLGLLD
jgi:hypothetical protein